MWIGIPRLDEREPLQPARSSVGGWLSEDEYLAAYQLHAPLGGKRALIGAYYGADEGLRVVKKAIETPLPSAANLTLVPTEPAKVQLRGASHAGDEQFVWGPASASWRRTGDGRTRPWESPTGSTWKWERASFPSS